MSKKRGINPLKIVSSVVLIAGIIYSVITDNKKNK